MTTTTTRKTKSKKEAPRQVAKTTKAYFFRLAAFTPKNDTVTLVPQYLCGVTWFRCRAYLATLLGVDATTVELELVNEKDILNETVLQVPDA